MSEQIFKAKLQKIEVANSSFHPLIDKHFPDIKENILKNFTPNLHDISQGVTAAAETIEKTKIKLLEESENNPALKLLLYRTDIEGIKILRKWTEMLFRLSIAQHIIEMCIAGKTISENYIENLYPNIRPNTLKHILNAVKLSTSSEEIEMKKILNELTIEPERYERLNKWNLSKTEYINLMIKYFLNCHLVLSSPAYRLRKRTKIFLVKDENDNYGIYTETTNKYLKVTSKLEYLGPTLTHNRPHQIKHIMDKLTIYGPRESMIWFINETMETLMFDFDWEECVKYAQFVYNTLCRI